MEGLPEDLIVDILLRFQVEDLLRFRCVSKRWRNLIDSPNFVKSQLNLPNKPQFVTMALYDRKLRFKYFEVDSDYIKNPTLNFKELAIPWNDIVFSLMSDVVGHCNGLLCCVVKNYRSFLVLNPSIRKYVQVPPPEPEEVRLMAFGFGYDKDSYDYKIVALEYLYENRGGGKLWIYSMKSCSWKNIAKFPYIVCHADGVFVNGALHWIVHRTGESSTFIFALHIGNLEHSLVAHPMCKSKELCLRSLGVLDGKLYAIRSGVRENVCYDFWVMKEYGVKESWTRLGIYNEHYIERESVFVTYGGSLVQCKFREFTKKIWFRKPGFGDASGKPLVYEPSLVWPWRWRLRR